MIRGAHQMSIGFTGEISRNLSNYHALDPMRLSIGGTVTGTGLSDLLTGKLTQLIQTGENRFDTTSQNIALYFMDTWKARPNLTVSMSLRWDPSIMPYLKHGGIANFDYDRFNKGYRNNLTYLPEWSFDMALSRSFRASESNRFEIRAEAFNVTNSFRPGPAPVSIAVGASNFNTVSSSTFGQIRTASDPRIMQFALKYVF